MKKLTCCLLIFALMFALVPVAFAHSNHPNPPFPIYNKPQHYPGSLPGYRPLPPTPRYNKWYPPTLPYYGRCYPYYNYPRYRDDDAVKWMLGLMLFQMVLQQSNQNQYQQQQIEEFMRNQQIQELTNRVLDEYNRQNN